MNQPLSIAAAIAGLLVPYAAGAADPDLTPSPDKYPVTQQANDVANDGAPEKAARKEDESPLGGVLVHNGKAYIVSRLQNEMSLPDGRKIEPDGTIVESDGSTRRVNSGEMLRLDGRIAPAPFEAQSKATEHTEQPQGSYNGTSDILTGGEGFSTGKPDVTPHPPAKESPPSKKEPAEYDPSVETPD